MKSTMKKAILNRIFPVLLAIVLCTGMVSSAFAEGEQPYSAPETGSETPQERHPIDIHEIILPTDPTGCVVFPAYIGTDEELAKAEELAAQCRKEGVSGDLEIALWMHDWLVNNANYDYTYTEYYPRGVLLKGHGVCQSYALAFEMLMKKMGIECVTLTSYGMNHAWNLVKLNGAWCHVDCTWDDPGEGGYERYDYFGLNDSIMGLDHQWDRSAYVSCTSLDNFYFRLSGGSTVSSKEELFALMDQKASAREDRIDCKYIGQDENFEIAPCFSEWVEQYEAEHPNCYVSYGGTYTKHVIHFSLYFYGEIESEKQQIQAPSFALQGVDGIYRSENYGSNSVVLVCGTSGNPKTTELMDLLNGELDELYADGVDVLVSLNGMAQKDDLLELQASYPNMHLTCGSSILREAILAAIGKEASPYFPVIAVVDENGCITYSNTDKLENPGRVISAAKATATGNPLPKPVPSSRENDANVGLGTIAGSAVVSDLHQLSRAHNGLIFLYSDTCGAAETRQMDAWESNIKLMNALDTQMVVCIGDFDDSARSQYAAAYPDIRFVKDDGVVYSALLDAVDGFVAEGVYLSNYLINGQGTVTRYSCGDVLDLTMCAARVARSIPCEVKMPAELTEIRQEAFLASGMRSADLTGTGITSIGARAFADNDQLVLVSITDSVTQIAEDAFDGCSSLVILCSADSTAYEYAAARGLMVLTN